MRRTDRNLRHDHQTSEGFGLTGFHPSSFNLQTSPAWAIARSDRLILEREGKDAENTKLGRTLSNDPLADKRFDFQFVNPPYGDEWSKDDDAVTTFRRDLHPNLPFAA